MTAPEEASTGRLPSATALVLEHAAFLPMEGEMDDAAADDVLLAASLNAAGRAEFERIWIRSIERP